MNSRGHRAFNTETHTHTLAKTPQDHPVSKKSLHEAPRELANGSQTGIKKHKGKLSTRKHLCLLKTQVGFWRAGKAISTADQQSPLMLICSTVSLLCFSLLFCRVVCFPFFCGVLFLIWKHSTSAQSLELYSLLVRKFLLTQQHHATVGFSQRACVIFSHFRRSVPSFFILAHTANTAWLFHPNARKQMECK